MFKNKRIIVQFFLEKTAILLISVDVKRLFL